MLIRHENKTVLLQGGNQKRRAIVVSVSLLAQVIESASRLVFQHFSHNMSYLCGKLTYHIDCVYHQAMLFRDLNCDH